MNSSACLPACLPACYILMFQIKNIKNKNFYFVEHLFGFMAWIRFRYSFVMFCVLFFCFVFFFSADCHCKWCVVDPLSHCRECLAVWLLVSCWLWWLIVFNEIFLVSDALLYFCFFVCFCFCVEWIRVSSKDFQ